MKNDKEREDGMSQREGILTSDEMRRKIGHCHESNTPEQRTYLQVVLGDWSGEMKEN